MRKNQLIKSNNSDDEPKRDKEYGALLKQLKENGIKYSADDIVFIAKDGTGQIVWLEKGSVKAGLKHIVYNHMQDFINAFSVYESDLPAFLESIVSQGVVVSNVRSKYAGGFDRIYEYEGNYCMFAGIGSNGFIVTAFPISK